MCRRVSCSKCGKPTWAGCGAHIESVLGDVPMALRCGCRQAKTATDNGDGGPTIWSKRVKN